MISKTDLDTVDLPDVVLNDLDATFLFLVTELKLSFFQLELIIFRSSHLGDTMKLNTYQ